jgi:hypothetical protein
MPENTESFQVYAAGESAVLDSIDLRGYRVSMKVSPTAFERI